jgi:hypothetical protein
MKKCITCNQNKAEDAFNKGKSYCRKCCKERDRKYYLKNKARRQAGFKTRRMDTKQFIWDLKNGPCTDCKKMYHPTQMDFDHTSSDKEKDISRLYSSNATKEKILEEVAKCELVCANCHRLRTAKRLGII